MPATPKVVSASRTSSSLNGLMIAMISFTCAPFALPRNSIARGVPVYIFVTFPGGRDGTPVSQRAVHQKFSISPPLPNFEQNGIEAVRRLLAFEAEAKGSPS